jgi:hypothetical protein
VHHALCGAAIAVQQCAATRRAKPKNLPQITPGFTFQPIGRNETFRNFDFRAVEPPIRYPVSEKPKSI